MKRTFILTILGATSVMFGQIVPNGPWQTVTTPVATTGEKITGNTAATNTAYWNNGTSDDSYAGNPGNTGAGIDTASNVCYNIGCFMTNSGAWNTVAFPGGVPAPVPNLTGPNLANPVFLGSAAGAAVPSFNFSGAGGAAGFPMLAEVAGANDVGWMGWYDTSIVSAAGFTAGNRGTLWDIIFTGAQQPGAAMVFTPTTNFGLFFFDTNTGATAPAAFGDTAKIVDAIKGVNSTGSGAFFTNSTMNVGDTVGNQHFAVFATSAAAAGVIPADFWVGVEDKPFAASDNDYNDMIVHLRIVPEPGYFLLLSLGLGGLGIARRRLNRA